MARVRKMQVSWAVLRKEDKVTRYPYLISQYESYEEERPNKKHHYLQICDITLVIDIDQAECFLPCRTTVLSSGQAGHLLHEHVELREIFEHSTDWTTGTPLNFIVQHQNIEFSYKLPLRKSVGVRNGGERDDDLIDVEFSRFARFKPLDEIWIFTEPHPDRL